MKDIFRVLTGLLVVLLCTGWSRAGGGEVECVPVAKICTECVMYEDDCQEPTCTDCGMQELDCSAQEKRWRIHAQKQAAEIDRLKRELSTIDPETETITIIKEVPAEFVRFWTWEVGTDLYDEHSSEADDFLAGVNWHFAENWKAGLYGMYLKKGKTEATVPDACHIDYWHKDGWGYERLPCVPTLKHDEDWKVFGTIGGRF